DVLLGPDDRQDRDGVPLREPLELSLAVLPRVHRDAALRAAERQVGDRALPGHEHREPRDLLEVHRWVEPDAALARAASGRVLDAVAGEDLELAVIHDHRHGDDERTLVAAKELVHPRIESEGLRGA